MRKQPEVGTRGLKPSHVAEDGVEGGQRGRSRHDQKYEEGDGVAREKVRDDR